MGWPRAVVTTINAPTSDVRALTARFPGKLIVIGDTKTPESWSLSGADYYSPQSQYASGLGWAQRAPNNHYARKNIGYLLAMDAGAPWIYDTDDDNAPNDNWRGRDIDCDVEIVTAPGWCNVYRLFTDAKVWPRGLCLEHVRDVVPAHVQKLRTRCPIQQGLVEGDPDVDAVWRLTAQTEVNFNVKRSVALGAGVWCPFNSQSTWWWPEAYPLLYLPVHATFRMTDIWRSFVAQRCLWEMGRCVAFHSPAEAAQKRNEHDLIADFRDEVPGYLRNRDIVRMFSDLRLGSDVYENLITCYAALAQENILPQAEVDSVEVWCSDVHCSMGSKPGTIAHGSDAYES